MYEKLYESYSIARQKNKQFDLYKIATVITLSKTINPLAPFQDKAKITVLMNVNVVAEVCATNEYDAEWALTEHILKTYSHFGFDTNIASTNTHICSCEKLSPYTGKELIHVNILEMTHTQGFWEIKNFIRK